MKKVIKTTILPTYSLSPAPLATMPPIRVMASLTRKSAPGGATGLSAALPVRAGAVGGPLAAV